MKLRTRSLAALAAVAFAASLGTCSQTAKSASDTSAANGKASTSSSASTDGSSVSDAEMEKKVNGYAIAVAQCMRDHGFAVSDPEPDKDAQIPAGTDPNAFNAQVDACLKELGPAPTQANEPKADELTERGLKTAKCLRNKGYDVADPKAGEASSFPGAPADAVRQCLAESGE